LIFEDKDSFEVGPANQILKLALINDSEFLLMGFRGRKGIKE